MKVLEWDVVDPVVIDVRCTQLVGPGRRLRSSTDNVVSTFGWLARLQYYTFWRIVIRMVNQSVIEDRLDVVFAALSDSSRRHIVTQLAERGTLSVGEASDGLELSPAGVTKHVKTLERAGLVNRRLDGRRHVLSLESERLLLAQDWIDRYRTIWTASLDRLATLAAELEQEETK